MTMVAGPLPGDFGSWLLIVDSISPIEAQVAGLQVMFHPRVSSKKSSSQAIIIVGLRDGLGCNLLILKLHLKGLSGM